VNHLPNSLAQQYSAPLWKRLLARSLEKPSDLEEWLGAEIPYLEAVVRRYPMRINPYYLGLIQERDDPIFKQCIPDPRELQDQRGLVDPLAEERFSPVPGLTHRYPDAVYCRFCNRKRKVGRKGLVTQETIREGIAYIKANKQIRDVLLSGGDPMLLETPDLEKVLRSLREIPHVQIIRIGTRHAQEIPPYLCKYPFQPPPRDYKGGIPGMHHAC